MVRRRSGLLAAAFLLLQLIPAQARSVTDSAGRQVTLPDRVGRVFVAGPPASVLLYALAPQLMVGWTRAPGAEAKRYLLPQVQGLPELGRLTGRDDALDLTALTAARPDLIVDFGTVSPAYRALADKVQAQTGIAYLLIDGSLERTPAALRMMGDVLGVAERGERLAAAAEAIYAEVDRVLAAVPADRRPRVYIARGSEGLQTASRGAISAEILERVGAVNVVEPKDGKPGMTIAQPAEVASWAPDVIIALERSFAQSVRSRPAWQGVAAVAAGHVVLQPGLPFGFADDPPSVNRLLGLTWLLHVLYPAQATGDLRTQVRSFYNLFYQVELDDAALDRLLGGKAG